MSIMLEREPEVAVCCSHASKQTLLKLPGLSRKKIFGLNAEFGVDPMDSIVNFYLAWSLQNIPTFPERVDEFKSILDATAPGYLISTQFIQGWTLERDIHVNVMINYLLVQGLLARAGNSCFYYTLKTPSGPLESQLSAFCAHHFPLFPSPIYSTIKGDSELGLNDGWSVVTPHGSFAPSFSMDGKGVTKEDAAQLALDYFTMYEDTVYSSGTRICIFEELLINRPTPVESANQAESLLHEMDSTHDQEEDEEGEMTDWPTVASFAIPKFTPPPIKLKDIQQHVPVPQSQNHPYSMYPNLFSLIEHSREHFWFLSWDFYSPEPGMWVCTLTVEIDEKPVVFSTSSMVSKKIAKECAASMAISGLSLSLIPIPDFLPTGSPVESPAFKRARTEVE